MFGSPVRSIRALLPLLLAVSVAAAACSSDDDTQVGSTDPGGADAASATGSDSGSGDGGGPRLEAAVLSGEATTIAGEAFDLGDLAGRDLVVWFWAPW